MSSTPTSTTISHHHSPSLSHSFTPTPLTPSTPTSSSSSLPSPLTANVSNGSGNYDGPAICHTCNLSITTSQFIRVGPYKFHRDHFACTNCKSALQGKKFHHRDNKFFCSLCFVDLFCNTCKKCNQKIASGSVIQAFGGHYHPEHFVCFVCSKPFANGKYYESGENPVCEQHYLEMTAEKCDGCKLPVGESDMVRVQGRVFHSNCLQCSHCHCSLAKKGSVFQKDKKVYCKNDYLNFFCKRCTKCGDFILKSCISVNDEYYHPDCLSCSVCEKKLEKYICIGGHLRCADHTEFACEKFSCDLCKLPIDEDDVMLAVGKKFHSKCFNCVSCKTPLSKATCKIKDNKICCENCLVKKENGQSVSPTYKSLPSPTMSPSSSISSSPSTSSMSTSVPMHFRTLSNSSTSSTSSSSSGISTSPSLSTSVSIPPSNSASSHQSSLSSPNPLSSTPSRGNLTLHRAAASDSSLQSSSSDSPTTTTTPSSGDEKSPHHRKSSSKSMHTRKASKNGNGEIRSGLAAHIDWRKGDMIGKGSFGKVYMAMNSATGELLAVKQVRLNTAEEQEQATAIQNEIALMENLRHPNIVALLGTERVGNKLNIIMEYVAGRSLDTLLDKFGAFSEKVVRQYTKQLSGALAYCHKVNIVHRDIKGKNILIDTKGNAKICDWGSAKRFQNVMSNNAPSLSYNYTPLWTAPEVLTGDYNSKVDVWSLGCVIIEMTTAKTPWSEQNFENPFRALYHIGNTDKIPNIPETLSAIGKDFVLKCLTRNPANRWTAQELLSHEWLQGIDESPLDGGGRGSDDDDDDGNNHSGDENDRNKDDSSDDDDERKKK